MWQVGSEQKGSRSQSTSACKRAGEQRMPWNGLGGVVADRPELRAVYASPHKPGPTRQAFWLAGPSVTREILPCHGCGCPERGRRRSDAGPGGAGLASPQTGRAGDPDSATGSAHAAPAFGARDRDFTSLATSFASTLLHRHHLGPESGSLLCLGVLLGFYARCLGRATFANMSFL